MYDTTSLAEITFTLYKRKRESAGVSGLTFFAGWKKRLSV